MTRSVSIAAISSVLLLALAGCASEPTFGERLASDAERRQSLADEALAAERDIARGETIIREARADRDASEARLREGRGLVEGGRDTLRRIEAETR
ncbi:hypothetical protein DYI37_04720 [Fulvimarina endophytica]|uniref:DUF4398 domain-containing protein n=1 Tax=Fulvimarina endophytica TaxID=2293836 RepID=A0A371X7H8_9HYPH|nr:hypothetical protein [Fulvimarina endophytica]RFC65157.1 hypothetical protein DYI37_04720 [Fulvimarina endophytica]